MTINEIIEYVLYTPTNTNKVILKGMIEELIKQSGGEGEATEVTTPEAIAEILASDEPNVAIKLASNMTLSDNIAIPEGKTVTFDLNGKKINTNGKQILINGGAIIVNDSTGSGAVVGSGRPFVVNNGELIVENGVIESTNDCAITAQNNGKVTVNGGTIKAQEVGVLALTGSEVIMNDGLVTTTDNFCIGGNGTPGLGGTTITINGGKLDAHIQSPGYVACGVYQPQDGVLNITGGEITAENGCGICVRAGVVNIAGGTIIGTGNSELLGKVGDSRVVVGPNGVVYDQSSHYPENQNLAVNISGGIIVGVNSAVDTIVDEGVKENINITGGTQIPSMSEETVIYDGGGVQP
jgi:hypothetical protein